MIESYLNPFWTNVFKDQATIQGLVNGIERLYLQIEMDLAGMNLDLSRYTLNTYRIKNWHLRTYKETELNTDVMTFDQQDIYFNGVYNFGSRTGNEFSLPLDSYIADIPFITSNPFNPAAILQKDIDYRIDTGRGFIFFKENPFLKGFEPMFEQEDVPVKSYKLWFYRSYMDYQDLRKLYGDPVKLMTPSSPYYKNVVNAIWNLRIEGGTSNNMKRLLCAVTDTDFVETAGTVTRIFSEGNRVCVLTETDIYTAPNSCNVLVRLNDSIEKGQLIFDNVKIFTSQDDIPWIDYPALHLGETLIGPEFKGGVLIENKDYPFPEEESFVVVNSSDGEAYVRKYEEPFDYLVKDPNGVVINLLTNQDDYTYKVMEVRYDLPFRGQPDTVKSFKDELVMQDAAYDSSICDVAILDNHGQVPANINLFKQYQKHLFSNNVLFIKINMGAVPEGIDPASFLNYIKFTLPAYSGLLTFLESSCSVIYRTSSVQEDVTVFYVKNASDSVSTSTYEETVTAGVSI